KLGLKWFTLPVESITPGFDALAFDADMMVMEGFLLFGGNNTGWLLEPGGIDTKLDEFLTANCALNGAFVLLSVTKVTVCGTPTFAALYQLTIWPGPICICLG